MSEAATLKRRLSLPLVTFYGIGTILGAGIYVLVGKVAGAAGMYAPLAFVLAALLAAFSAFSYAELSTRMPKSAGEAVYVQAALGWRRLSIVVGLMVTLVGAISVATMAHGFVGYLVSYLVGYLELFSHISEAWVIVSLILVLGLVTAWGIGESVMIASIMTVLEMAGLVMIVWVSRDGFANLPEQLPAMIPGLDMQAWVGIWMGCFLAFYAFLGFEDIVNVAEEVREPQRNLPRAIIIALVVTSLFYLVVAMVSVLVISPAQLAQSNAPLALVYTHVTGQSPVVITLISLVAVLNGALVQIIMASRILYGMSNQGWIHPFYGRVSPRTRTPLNATLIVTVVVLLLALWLPLLSLAKLTSFIILIVFTLINLALWLLKRREPAKEGVFQVPMWIPVIGFFSSGTFVVFQLVSYLQS